MAGTQASASLGQFAAWGGSRGRWDLPALVSTLHAVLVGAQRAQAYARMEVWEGGPELVIATSEGGSRPAAGAGRSADLSLKIQPSGSSSGGGSSSALERRERTERAPPPRTAGACFSPSGLLVSFSNTPVPYAGLADSEAPRTCRRGHSC